MDFYNYLKDHQPFVYNTFSNAQKNNKIAQAYLIKGNDGAPVFECAKFLAKSLICEDDSPFACDECMSCIRFDGGNYADLMILDSSKQSVKVSDIESLQEFISSSCLESKGKKIYIINLLENCSKETINALLKTLEEPFPNTFAFITTQNESKILQTIISRCQVLNLLPIDKETVLEEVLSKGVSKEDAEILSSLYTNVDTILEYINDETFLKCKTLFLRTLDALKESSQEALFTVENEVIAQLKKKEDARLYFDLITLAFKDVLHLQLKQSIVMEQLRPILEEISSKNKNFEKYYLEMMLTRSKIDINVSIPLLIEHSFIYMIKGGK